MVDTEPSWCGHPGDLDEPGLRCYQKVVETTRSDRRRTAWEEADR
jgi:hypothetical protein